MANKSKLHKLTNFERQVFIYEIFSGCKYIDHAVLNQYFHFVDGDATYIRFSPTLSRMISRDFKDLRDAGVISYTYNKESDWYESEECDFVMRIPENADEKKIKYLERLNFICRYLKEITGLEEMLREKEIEEMEAIDEPLFMYMLSLSSSTHTEVKSLSDYDMYKHTDPYIIEYVRLKGETSYEELKQDFELLKRLGYLEYDFYNRRFSMKEEFYPIYLPRQDFGIVKGKDGGLYIREE